MTMLKLLIPLIALPLLTAAQEAEPPDGTRIVSVVVSGLNTNRLSAGLREDIGKLSGSTLDRQRLRELSARIEAEHPRYIVGLRLSQERGDGARVDFVVRRISDEAREANINARYVVEEVVVRGVPESDLAQALRDDLHALAGRPLDSEAADRLEIRLEEALPHHEVRRRTVKGSQPGRIRLIFDVRRAEWSRWLRFEPMDANGVYHSDQGWGAKLPVSMSGRDLHITPFGAMDVGDDLIEEYSGFGVRIETRKLVSERLGAFFEWSSLNETWRDSTLAALASSPGAPTPYRSRMTVTPVLKFAITPRLTLAGGVRIAELESLHASPDSEMANAAIGSLSFSLQSRPKARPRQDFEAAVALSTGTRALESDLVYHRYVGQAEYLQRWDRHELHVSAMAGGLSGDAPLFERFSLGDSRTLRGWDKYDLAPAGGDRMVHASVEYQYGIVGIFLDSGSVWNDGAESRFRASTGVTFSPGPVFFTVGFPLNTSEFRAVFTMGIRFPGSSVSIRKY